MLHTYMARYSTDLYKHRTNRSSMMREINHLGYEPGRLSFYFCVARKDARRRLCAFLLLVDLTDTNNNLSLAKHAVILRICKYILVHPDYLSKLLCEFDVLFKFFLYYLSTRIISHVYIYNSRNSSLCIFEH